MVMQARSRQAFAVALESAHLARLIGDHGRKQAVAVAEPLVEAFLGAVGRARHAGSRQGFLSAIHEKLQSLLQNGVLTR